MSLYNVKFRDNSMEEKIGEEVKYSNIISELEKKLIQLQKSNDMLEDKLLDYMTEDIESIKSKNKKLEEENIELRFKVTELSNETVELHSIIKGLQKEFLVISEKCCRPSKYSKYYGLIFFLYNDLKSISKVKEELQNRDINISSSQIRNIVNKTKKI